MYLVCDFLELDLEIGSGAGHGVLRGFVGDDQSDEAEDGGGLRGQGSGKGG